MSLELLVLTRWNLQDWVYHDKGTLSLKLQIDFKVKTKLKPRRLNQTFLPHHQSVTRLKDIPKYAGEEDWNELRIFNQFFFLLIAAAACSVVAILSRATRT